ncbi:MAG: hypothetical protein JXQ90_16605 [Cyclobacteriaceae bacterium]
MGFRYSSLILSIFFLQAFVPSFAQEWQLTDSILFNTEITALSSDPAHNIYAGGINGAIIRVDGNSSEIQKLQAPTNGSIAMIDANNPLKLFVSSIENQEFAFIERLISRQEKSRFSTYSSDYVQCATPFPDNSIWMLSMPSRELKQYNTMTGISIQRVPITPFDIDDPISMLAYRNKLILSSTNTTLILNQFGQRTAQRTFDEIKSVQVKNDMIWILTTKKLMGLNMSLVTQIEYGLPSRRYDRFVMLSDQTVFSYDNRLDFYSIPR